MLEAQGWSSSVPELSRKVSTMRQSFAKLVGNLAEYVFGSLFLVVLPYGALIFGCAAGVIYDNAVVKSVIPIGLVLTLVWIVLILYSASLQPPAKDPELEHPGIGAILSVLGVIFYPLSLIVFISSFVFKSPLVDTETVWITEGRTTLHQSWAFAIPFYHAIVGIDQEQVVSFRAVAETRDGKRVEAQLRAEMVLIANDEVLVRLSKAFPDPNQQIVKELEGVLEHQFQQIVASRTADELHDNLAIEWDTGSGIDGQLLTHLGVRWGGTLALTDLHAYLGEDRPG